MVAEEGSQETKVSDWGMVPIPAEFRRRLNIEPGDKLRQTIDGEGTLFVDPVHQREDVFDGFEPVEAGETNAVEVERQFEPE